MKLIGYVPSMFNSGMLKRQSLCLSLWLALCFAVLSAPVHAQQSSVSSATTSVESSSAASTSSDHAASAGIDIEKDEADADDHADDNDWRDKHWDWSDKHWRHDRHRNEKVSVGHDVTLRAGDHARSVVAVLGDVNSEGDVARDVVAVAGNVRVTGPVGHDVVSVLGDVYINSEVGHDVVATMGDIKLGPQAVINGQLVATGGTVDRDAAAVVRGGVTETGFGSKLGIGWLKPWIDHCLKYGRPLAIASGLGWAWGLALFSLLFYVLIALAAPRAVNRCVTTLATSPGYSLLAALLATLATPILFVLLVVTVVGILAIPFLGIAIFCVGVFGRLVMLAWLGRCVVRMVNGSAQPPAALATLLGGVIVAVLYLVPVLGFVVYKLLGFVGFGVVVYTLILMANNQRQPDRQATSNSASQQHIPPQAAADESMAGNDPNATQDANANTQQPTNIDVSGLPRATFGVRMGALLVDVALVAFVLNVTLSLHDMLLLALAVYGALMWKLKGTTIGGILFNLRVMRLDGRELDWPTVVVRSLSCFLSLIALGLGFIWMAFDPEQQAWHDKIAGTVVVRTPKGVSLV